MTFAPLPSCKSAATLRAAVSHIAFQLCLAGCLGLVLLLSACGRDLLQEQDKIPFPEPASYAQFAPSFDLKVRADNIMPYPNNLLFHGSSDGTINAPVNLEASNAAMLDPLNTLDGFSTIAPFTATFNVKPDAGTLVAGSSVRVFEVQVDSGRKVTTVVRELAVNEYSVRPDLNTLALATASEAMASAATASDAGAIPPPGPPGIEIVPNQALQPKTSYMAILTNSVKDQAGNAFAPSAVYALTKLDEALIDSNGQSRVQKLDAARAKEVDDLRPFTRAAENAAIAFDPDLLREQIILSWSFTTQSIDDSLQMIRKAINDGAPPPSTLTDFHRETPHHMAWIYTGTVTLPYYLGKPIVDVAGKVDATPALKGFWHAEDGGLLRPGHRMPKVTESHAIPLVATIPKGSKPEGGWPVVIFQHGNTSNRAALVSIADKLAAAGFAAVAIDLPMHGITGNEVDGSELLRQAGLERTFDLDLIPNTPPEPPADDEPVPPPAPDGITDTSGSFFIKLNEVLTTRDNIRQGVADLMGLRRALAAMDYDNDRTNTDFDIKKVRFVGHSLGATVGAVYLGVEAGSDVAASTLGMPGGAIAKQLDGSPTSGPSIALGMKENGLHKGTQDYERFLAAVQMVLDAADPLNYAKGAVKDRPLHVIEVVGGASLGDGKVSLPDQIVPNNVLNVPDTVSSPTGGTDPLCLSMGLTTATTTTSGPDLRVVVRFNAGHHSSLISTFDAAGDNDDLSRRVQEEMQSQIASFVSSNGAQLTISDPGLVTNH